MSIIPKTVWVTINGEEIGTGDDVKIRRFKDSQECYIKGNVLVVTEQYIELADFKRNCGQIVYISDIENIIKL